MRYLAILSFVTLLSACTAVNIKPPYADTKKINNYSTLKASVAEKNPINGILFTVDGQYSISQPGTVFAPKDDGPGVSSMNVLPGEHRIRAGCIAEANIFWFSSISFEFTLEFEPSVTYELLCSSDNEKKKANFTVRNTKTNAVVELKAISIRNSNP